MGGVVISKGDSGVAGRFVQSTAAGRLRAGREKRASQHADAKKKKRALRPLRKEDVARRWIGRGNG